jgi:hypothetical protein
MQVLLSYEGLRASPKNGSCHNLKQPIVKKHYSMLIDHIFSPIGFTAF